jgi:hypothetical protein
MKRSQISIFILVGLLVAVLAVVVILTRTIDLDASQMQVGRPDEAIPFESFIQVCLEETTDAVLHSIIKEGGQPLLYRNKNQRQISYLSAPVYYISDGASGISYLPSTSDLELDLSYRIASEISACLSGFEFFSRTGYRLIVKPYEVSTTLTSQGTIQVLLDTSYELRREDMSYTTGLFTYETKSNIQFFLSMVQSIITEMDVLGNNTFPDIHTVFLSLAYDFNYTKMSQKNSTLFLFFEKPSITSRYIGTMDIFPAVFVFNWSHLYIPPNTSLSEIPVFNSFEWVLPDSFGSHLVNNFSDSIWDITSYFPDYVPPNPNPGLDLDFFSGYSENFDLLYTGNIYPYYFPDLGPNTIIVKAYSLENSSRYTFGQFIINTRFSDIVPLTIMSGNTSQAFRGFHYYERIIARSHDGSPLRYQLLAPVTLTEMDCGGYLEIDRDTGEIGGYITALPGSYPLRVIISSDHREKNLDMTLHISGNYELDCR